MKNKLTDLNNHLFAQLERLADEDLGGQELIEEIRRAKAVTDVGNVIVMNARLALDAQKFMADNSRVSNPQLPEMLENNAG